MNVHRPEPDLHAAWARGDLEALVAGTWAACAVELARYFLRAGVPAVEVDDLRQEVMARFVRELDGFDGASVRGWVFTLARYELLTWRKERLRARGRREQANARSPETPWPRLEDDLARASFLQDIADTLTPENELLFRAFEEEGDDAEISERLTEATGRTWNVNMVRCQRRRLRAEVRERYRAAFGEEGP